MTTDTLDMQVQPQDLAVVDKVEKLKQALQDIAVACKTEHWAKHDIRRLAEAALTL